VLKGVAQTVFSWSAGGLTLAGQLAISPQGTLAYLASPTPSLPTSELVTVSREGQITPLGGAPAAGYRDRVESSPDGARVAVPVQTTRNVRLFLYDLVRETLTPAIAESADREAFAPVWSSDGKIAVSVFQEGTGTDLLHLEVLRADSPAPPETIKDSDRFVPNSWSRDGGRLVGSKAGDLWVYSPNDPSSNWTQLTQTDAREIYAAWSPDGQWLAYVSDVSGRVEVYVQPYPGSGRIIPISNNRGRSPAWNPSGRELFYLEPAGGSPAGPSFEEYDWRMMSVDMTTPLRPGRPVPLFSFSPASLMLGICEPNTCYSVAPNGQEFFTLRMRPRQSPRVTQIRLIVNWFEDLKRLVPGK
jgi:hypothetical protein